MIVSEEDITQAMQRCEDRYVRAHGPLDKIHLPKDCATLCDLLGTMWFHNETQANIPDESPLAKLIKDTD